MSGGPEDVRRTPALPGAKVSGVGGRRAGRRLELSGTQVVGAALATMTGTVFASQLGVLGTVAGAVVMSVASTVGTAVYQYYLKRGGDRLRDARDLAETAGLRHATRAHRPGAPEGGLPVDAPVSGDPASDRGDAGSGREEPIQATLPFLEPAQAQATGADRPTGTPASATGHRAEPGTDRDAADGDRAETGTDRDAADGDGHPEASDGDGHTDAADGDGHGAGADGVEAPDGGRRRSWKVYAAMAAGVFVLVMGGITIYEAIVGKPLSAVVNGDKGSGTTLGDLGGGPGTTGTPPDDGATTDATTGPRSTTQDDDGGTDSTPRPDESDSTGDSGGTGGDSGEDSGGGDSGDPTPEPTSGEGGQTPAPGDDGALGDGGSGIGPGDPGQNLGEPDVATPPPS